MKIIFFIILLLVVLFPLRSDAWEYKTTVGQNPLLIHILKHEAADLPICVQKAISSRLHVVLLVNHDNGSTDEGPDAIIDATSFPNGIMLLVVGHSDITTAYMHELGHYYDWEKHISQSKEFRNALKLDITELSPKLQKQMHYILMPKEAYAELFAAHFLGDAYYRFDHYNVDVLPHSMTILENSLCRN